MRAQTVSSRPVKEASSSRHNYNKICGHMTLLSHCYRYTRSGSRNFDGGESQSIFLKKKGQLFFNALQCSYFSSEERVWIYFCVSHMTHHQEFSVTLSIKLGVVATS